jgi:hypothetical protein
VLRAQLDPRRLRFTDDHRIRLAQRETPTAATAPGDRHYREPRLRAVFIAEKLSGKSDNVNAGNEK